MSIMSRDASRVTRVSSERAKRTKEFSKILMRSLHQCTTRIEFSFFPVFPVGWDGRATFPASFAVLYSLWWVTRAHLSSLFTVHGSSNRDGVKGGEEKSIRNVARGVARRYILGMKPCRKRKSVIICMHCLQSISAERKNKREI